MKRSEAVVGMKVRRTSGDRQTVGTVVRINGDSARVCWKGRNLLRVGGNDEIHSTVLLRSLIPVVEGEVYRPFVVARPRYDESGATCPDCGARLRIHAQPGIRRSGRSHSHSATPWTLYSCPVAEAEVYADERGHLKREAGAKHTTVRSWTLHNLGLPLP